MDRFSGELGPGDPGYEKDVDEIASALEFGKVVHLKFHANHTAMNVLLLRLGPGFELAPESRWFLVRPAGFGDQDGIFVGIENGKAAWLPWTPDGLHPGYVGSYLGHSWGENADGSDPFVTFLNDVARQYALHS